MVAARGRGAVTLATSAALLTFLLIARPLHAEQNDLPNADSDVQNLLFFGPLRPLWIRLRVTIDGKGFRDVWRANVSQLFADADTDHDGKVPLGKPASQSEQASAESVANLAKQAAVYLGQDVAAAQAGLEQLAREHGAAVAFDDFAEYFRRIAPPLSLVVGAGRTSAGQALFPLLDANGDQQLTADELNAAESRLRNRDFDDNESLTRAELVDAPNTSLAAVAQAVEERQSSPLPTAGPFALLDRTPGETVARALLAEYDRDGNRRLSTSGEAAEITPTAGQLVRLGGAAGDEITAEQLARFSDGAPDLELKIELGKVSLTSRRLGGARSRRPAADAAPARLKQRPDGSWDVTLDDAHLYLRRNNRDPAKNADTGPGFSTFDADNNGYLDEKELAAATNLPGDFESIDTDRDGKIFAGEFNAYIDRRNRASSVRLLLEVFDQGQELFDQLDENHDHRLSTRELQAAAEAIGQIDANHDGRLSAGEIPQQVVLELSRNTPGGAVAERRSIRGGDRVRVVAKRGPSWFQKMDRNDDGEVSPREFLGASDLFERFDRDRDGVIDVNEAEAAKK